MEGEVDKILIKRSKCLEKITELFDNNINNPFIIDKIHEKIMNLDLFVVNIKKEVEDAKKTFKKYKWPMIDVTRKSVEETAASIIKIYEIYKQNG